jgi:hypothetical protein
LSSIGVASLSGCTGGESTDAEESENTPATSIPTDGESNTAPKRDFDVALEVTLRDGESPDGVPPEIAGLAVAGDGRRRLGYTWVVVDFRVIEGTLDMQDLWFDSRVETGSRFYSLDHGTADANLGVQSRGEITAGGRGIALYQVPKGTESVTWNLSLIRQSISASNIVQRSEPKQPTAEVEVEYAIETGRSLPSIPDETQRRLDDGNEWAAVLFTVTEGHLSMSEIWFDSRLETSSRLYQLDHGSADAELGVLSRGTIQTGGDGRALYQVPERASSFSWNLAELDQDATTVKR